MPGLSFFGPRYSGPVLLVNGLDQVIDSYVADAGGLFTSASIHGGLPYVNSHFIPNREDRSVKRLRLS
jgi:hypothetical protein